MKLETTPAFDADYRRLLDLRTGLRQFLHWSEQQAPAVGITPAQHQLNFFIPFVSQAIINFYPRLRNPCRP